MGHLALRPPDIWWQRPPAIVATKDGRGKNQALLEVSLLLVSEVAQTMRMSPARVVRHIKAGHMPATRWHGRYYVPRAWLEELVADAFAQQAQRKAKQTQLHTS